MLGTGFPSNSWNNGRNLPTRIKSMGRADLEGKEIDTGKWTIVVSEQGIGDQVCFFLL